MTSKGNLKLGSSTEETPINTVQVPQSESGHLTLPQTTWLSRLGINHRRSSMGFTMGTSMHELDEENSNSFSNAFSISKSTLGLETPIEAEGEVGGHFVQVTEDGKFKLEGYQSTYHNYESSHSETLKDALGTAINVSEFPVATQESLAQLEEMKMRLNKSSDDAVFDMDLDVDNSTTIPAIVVDDSSPGPSRKTSREQAEQAKPSKLLSNIMQSGFAQNWFFKGDGEMSTEDKSQKTEEKFTSTAFMHDETENANFPFAFSGIEEGGGKRKGMTTKATADKKLVEEQKQKREFRERNVFMPQNF